MLLLYILNIQVIQKYVTYAHTEQPHKCCIAIVEYLWYNLLKDMIIV